MDIKNRQDIQLLVDSFYKKVLKDEVISKFFTQVIELDWELHMPVMYDFWESTLLGAAIYKGNPMVKHMELNRKEKMEDQHFDRWLKLWKETVDECFDGPKSEETKTRAEQIASLMKYKVAHS